MCGLLAICAATVSRAGEGGYGRYGLRGGDYVGVLNNDERAISVTGQSGYGIVESMGPVKGAHHGLYGTFAASVHLLPQFEGALGVRGLIQYHPADRFGDDRSILGEPWLLLRSGFNLNSRLMVGAELHVTVPGAEAPSIDWTATTIDMITLGTLSLSAQMTLAARAGFRLDNSKNAAPDLSHTRFGDRISFPLSSSHAILAGLLWMYHFPVLSVFTELSADFLVGNDSGIATSPMRLAAGARYELNQFFSAGLTTCISLSKRPDIMPDDPIVPIEPRFTILLNATLTFGKTKAQPEVRTPENTSDTTEDTAGAADIADTAKTGASTGAIASTIVDNEGQPIAGATVTVTADKFEKAVKTDREGRFEITDVPKGMAHVRVEMPYFETRVYDVDIQAGELITAPVAPLIESEVGSQLRGLIRNFKGDPIAATIRVTPGNIEIGASEKGEFLLDVEPGKYTVTIRAKGYQEQKRRIKVEQNSVEILNVELRKK